MYLLSWASKPAYFRERVHRLTVYAPLEDTSAVHILSDWIVPEGGWAWEVCDWTDDNPSSLYHSYPSKIRWLNASRFWFTSPLYGLSRQHLHADFAFDHLPQMKTA